METSHPLSIESPDCGGDAYLRCYHDLRDALCKGGEIGDDLSCL